LKRTTVLKFARAGGTAKVCLMMMMFVLKALKLAAAAVALLLAAQFVRPARTNPPEVPGAALEHQVAVPPEVASVLARSCADCHTNRTSWPWYSHVAPASWFVIDHVNHGRRHLNFSDWSRYDRRESADLLRQVCRTARAGTMPLPSYTLLHPRARLTPHDVQTLCEWSDAQPSRGAASEISRGRSERSEREPR
jgi:hypothetical protein